MAQNNQKNGNLRAEDGMPHIEFLSGADEDPIAELVRQGLEQYVTVADTPDTAEGNTAESTPPRQQNQATMVANVAEQVVAGRILKSMQQAGGCTCDHCISDAVALVLNSLTPQYMVGTKKELQQRMAAYEKDNEAKITAAVVSACVKVTGHPRH